MREPVEVENFIDADGTRAIGGLQAVFAAADGRVVRWSPSGISQEQVPLLEGDELVAVVVDASGYIYGIGRERALYERNSLRWRVYPYPDEDDIRPLGAATSPGGQVYIVGRDGLLIRFHDGEWDRPLVPGLSPDTIHAPWYEAWYSAVTGTLWVRAGRDRLLEIEMGQQRSLPKEETPPTPEFAEDEEEGGKKDKDKLRLRPGDAPVEGPKIHLHLSGSVPVREHPIPVGLPGEGEPPAGFTAITGVSKASGDRVITSAGGKLWLFERERFVQVADDVGLVHDIAL
ncbi:MAG: hypothetical protein KC457_20270, partial [Myxococcales bacterium]|nr:hypothetical protein [Myxococcales bacterium]